MISFKGLFGLFANYDEVYAADHKYLGKSYGQKKKKKKKEANISILNILSRHLGLYNSFCSCTFLESTTFASFLTIFYKL